MTLNRREFVQLAAAMGASLAWGGSARASTTGWHERRDLYPEGVASGDPDPSSIILWTRRPFESGGRRVLALEVAEDDAFRRVVAKASAPVSAESDWTTRVLVGHLKPARVYWYRFTDGEGNGSRGGRTIEPNNLTAINSLIAYRSVCYGRHLDLILTDQHSFCGDDPTDAEGVGKIYDPASNGMFSEPAMIALDAAPSTAANRPPNSALATQASLIRERIHRRARCSAPVRRNGSWTSSVGPRQPGRSGAIRARRFQSETFPAP